MFNNRKTILYVSPGYFHALEALFLHLAKEFNFRVIFISHQAKNGNPSELLKQEVDYEIWDFPSAKLSKLELSDIPRLFGALVRELRRRPCDLVISSTQHTVPSKMLYFLRPWFRYKFAVISEVWCYDNSLSWPYLLYGTLSKRVLTHADFAFCRGTRSLEFARGLGARREKSFIFPIMCEDLSMKPQQPTLQVKEAVDRLSGHIKFGYVGRFVEEKGLIPLVRAFHRVLSQHPETALVLVGAGPLRETLEREIDGSPNIVMLDWIAPESLSYLYSQLDAFVLPSFYDGWSTVTSEAASVGLPLIITNMVGCAPDLVDEGKNGYVISPNDITQLETAILDVVARGTDGRKEMGNLSRYKYCALSDYKIHINMIRRVLELVHDA